MDAPSNEMGLLAQLMDAGVIAAVPLRPDEVPGRDGCALVVALMRSQTFAALSRQPLSTRELDLLARSRSPTAVMLLTARLCEHRTLRPDTEWRAGWRVALRDASLLEPTADDVPNARASPFTRTYRAERNICLGNGRGRCRLRFLLARVEAERDDAGEDANDDYNDGNGGAVDDDDDSYGPMHAARTVSAARGNLQPIDAETQVYQMSTDMGIFFRRMGVSSLVDFRNSLAETLRARGTGDGAGDGAALGDFVARRMSAPEVAVLACEYTKIAAAELRAFAGAMAVRTVSSAAWRAELEWTRALRRRERGLSSVPREDGTGVLYDAPTALRAFLSLYEPPGAAAASTVDEIEALHARIASLESELCLANARLVAGGGTTSTANNGMAASCSLQGGSSSGGSSGEQQHRQQQHTPPRADRDRRPAKTPKKSRGFSEEPPLSARIQVQSTNPKQPGSKCHARYELYKDARTVREYLQRGGSRGDLAHDLRRSFVRFAAPANDGDSDSDSS